MMLCTFLRWDYNNGITKLSLYSPLHTGKVCVSYSKVNK